MNTKEKNNDQPISIKELLSLSSKILETEKKIEAKKSLVSNEKNNQKQGFFNKFFTMLFADKKDSIEVELVKLTSELSAYKTTAQSLATSYLFEQARIKIKENHDDHETISSIEDKIKKQSEKLDKLFSLHDSIHNTSIFLKTARDHRTSSPTDNTYNPIEEARAALLELARKLPSNVHDINTDAQGELSYTFLDASPWFNADLILSKYSTETNDFFEDISVIIGYLNNTIIAVDEIVKKIKVVNEELGLKLINLKKPYFNQVRSEMPDNLFPFWQPL